MLVKIEALKGNYAAFDQVFTDHELAFDKFNELKESGWKVGWTYLPMDIDTYFKKANEEINNALKDLYGEG